MKFKEFDFKKINLSDLSLEWLFKHGIDYGLKLIIAILIIFIGFWLSSKFSKSLIKYLSKRSISESLRYFLYSLLSIFLKIIVVVIAMNTVGIETTTFAALLGGLVVGLGFALQGSLANLAGGLLILLFKPFKVGDVVESLNKMGTVERIDILHTIILMANGQTVILPNGKVFNNLIINISSSGFRRIEIQVRISYEDDFDKVKEVLLEVLKSESEIIEEKGYIIEINDFGENSVLLAMYCYCNSPDYMRLRWKLNRATKIALDKHGFAMPLPRRDLKILGEKEIL